MLGGPLSVPAPLIDPAGFPAVPDASRDVAPGFADGRVRKVLGFLMGVVTKAAPFGRIDRATLEAAGLTAEACREAAVYAYRCKAKLPAGALPGASKGTVAGLLGTVAGVNRRVFASAPAACGRGGCSDRAAWPGGVESVRPTRRP